jgi:hypothetical protein
MTKRKVTKLFAVVALAPAIAVAGPEHAEHREMAPVVEQRDVAGDMATTSTAAVAGVKPVAERALAVFGIAAPRQLKTGAPACGNVASKSPRRQPCE